MNRKDAYRDLEYMMRDCDTYVRSLWPDFNSHPNAERIICCLLKANEALRQIQRGNMETIYKYIHVCDEGAE